MAQSRFASRSFLFACKRDTGRQSLYSHEKEKAVSPTRQRATRSRPTLVNLLKKRKKKIRQLGVICSLCCARTLSPPGSHSVSTQRPADRPSQAAHFVASLRNWEENKKKKKEGRAKCSKKKMSAGALEHEGPDTSANAASWHRREEASCRKQHRGFSGRSASGRRLCMALRGMAATAGSLQTRTKQKKKEKKETQETWTGSGYKAQFYDPQVA